MINGNTNRFIIISMPRTGSNYLLTSFWTHPFIVTYGELINMVQLKDNSDVLSSFIKRPLS